tara:strand:+ start:827 stop:979 length:153 start_codon:yes stop_codon:yes gene_type:complete
MRDKKTRRIYCRNRQLISKILKNKSSNISVVTSKPNDYIDRLLKREQEAI